MLVQLLTILHLIAGDLALPPALHAPLVRFADHIAPQPIAPVPSAALADAPDVLTPAALPTKDRGAVSFKIAAARGIVLDADTAQVLLQKNADQPASMASIAKLMVALEAIDEARSNDQVLTVPAAVAKLDPVSSVAGLKPGERVTVDELMKALLVASANDAAVTLATGLAGSEKKFVEHMNERAVAMGLDSTHFANATGLDAAGNESTARDLAFLLLTAEREPLVRSLTTTGATSIRTEGGTVYSLKPTDQLLGTSTGFTIDAAKTGTTDLAGASFAVIAERDGRRVVAVLLDSPDRFSEARQTLQYAFDSFTWPTGDARVTGETQTTRFGG